MEDALAKGIQLLKERRLAQIGYGGDIIVTKSTEDKEEEKK